MKAPGEFNRTDNRNKDRRLRKHCGACGDNGWVPETYRTDTHNNRHATVEEMAPCPFCQRGYIFEYPDPKWLAKPEATQPPWGLDGYWQGRDIPEHLVKLWVDTGRPQQTLSQAQQIAAAKALASSLLGTIDREIEPKPRPPLVTNETADWAGTYTFEPEPGEPEAVAPAHKPATYGALPMGEPHPQPKGAE